MTNFEVAYDMDNLSHSDLSYTQASRMVKELQGSPYNMEVKEISWTDAEGYQCSTYRLVEKTVKDAGMTLEEAKEYIAKRNTEECFGYSYKELMAKQYK